MKKNKFKIYVVCDFIVCQLYLPAENLKNFHFVALYAVIIQKTKLMATAGLLKIQLSLFNLLHKCLMPQ